MGVHLVNFAREARLAKSLCGDLSRNALKSLEALVGRHKLSIAEGDLKFLNSGWYVTHSGLLRLAEQRRCAGMHVRPVLESCDPANSRWVFRTVVFKSRTDQRQEFAALVENTVQQVDSGHFLAHSGIRFPQNPCLSCPYMGLCLGKPELVEAKLVRRPGGSLVGVFNELAY